MQVNGLYLPCSLVISTNSHDSVFHISLSVSPSFTARAEFPSAKAVRDGFGGADLTVSKLLSKKWS
jgi:hypothetical protein